MVAAVVFLFMVRMTFGFSAGFIVIVCFNFAEWFG